MPPLPFTFLLQNDLTLAVRSSAILRQGIRDFCPGIPVLLILYSHLAMILYPSRARLKKKKKHSSNHGSLILNPLDDVHSQIAKPQLKE